jgi:hypothetical protein
MMYDSFPSAAPHPNINLQMNYWPALPCNLSECQEPLFDFIGSLSVNGAKTAKVSQLAEKSNVYSFLPSICEKISISFYSLISTERTDMYINLNF